VLLSSPRLVAAVAELGSLAKNMADDPYNPSAI
jgi:hypothetical protein